jgi:hypothetical protein
VQSILEQLRNGLTFPTSVTMSVRIGQLLAFTLATMSVNEDVLSSTTELAQHMWRIRCPRSNPYAANRFYVIVLLFLRLSVGCLAMIVGTLVIVRSDDLLEIFFKC